MLTIRSATREDFEGVCRLVHSKEELFLVYPAGKYPLTVDQLDQLSIKRRELTVAVLDGAIIGFANLYDLKKDKYAFIGNVIVERAHRGKGVGKELITYMLAMMREEYQLSQARISVFSQNTSALLLYKHFDFKPYAIDERQDVDNKRVALIHMKKKLN